MTHLLQKSGEELKPARTSFVPQWGADLGVYLPFNPSIPDRKFGPYYDTNGRIDAIKIIPSNLNVPAGIDIRINGKWQSENSVNGHVLELNEQEYIWSATVYYEIEEFGTPPHGINYVLFETNYNNVISYGKEDGKKHQEPLTDHGMLSGIKGELGEHSNILNMTLYWGPAIKYEYTPAWLRVMGNHDAPRDTYYREMGVAEHKITAIRLNSNFEGLEGVSFQINHDVWKTWGRILPSVDKLESKLLVLYDDEYINKCSTKTKDKYISYCAFSTSKGRVIAVGDDENSVDTVYQTGLLVDCRANVSFSGRKESFHYIQLMWIGGAEGMEPGEEAKEAANYEITTVEFDIDAGQIIDDGIPEVIAIQTLTNNSDTTQTMQFQYAKEITETIIMNHEAGASVTIGTEMGLEIGIPKIGSFGQRIELSTTSHYTFTYGTENSTTQTFTGIFNVACPPRSTVICNAVMLSSVMDVPYKVILENGMGNKQIASGTWRAVSAYNVQSVIEQPKRMEGYPLSKL